MRSRNRSDVGGTVYSYSIPTGSYDGVGNFLGFFDSVMGLWGFGYDPLNRLSGGDGCLSPPLREKWQRTDSTTGL